MARPISPPFQAQHLDEGRRNVQEYGTVDLTGVRDCSLVLNTAFADVAEHGDAEIYLPPGTYRTTQPLVWPASPSKLSGARLSGAGASTVIRPDASDFDWLTIGDGTTVGTGPGTGWVRDLVIRGRDTTLAPSGITAGLALNAMRGIEVRNVHVDYAPIGFDLRNNCFGSSFYGCRTIFDRCRIGLLLRRESQAGGGFGSGNDLPFVNCWFNARDAAVWIVGGGGYHFYGGQLGLLGGTFDDRRGNIIINAEIAGDGSFDASSPSTVGSGALSFFGTSFEGTAQGWTIRPWAGRFSVECHSCFFSGKVGAAGLIKVAAVSASTAGRDLITLINSSVTGAWSADPPIVLNTVAGERPAYQESGSFTSGSLTIGVTSVPFLSEEGLLHRGTAGNREHVLTHAGWTHRGIRFRRVGSDPANTLQLSVDSGATWHSVNTTVVV